MSVPRFRATHIPAAGPAPRAERPSMLVVYVFGAWVGIIALPFGFVVGYAVCSAVSS